MDWDDFSRPWLDAAPALEIAHAPVLAALMEAADLSPGDCVLDIGCGTGPSLVKAAQAVGRDGHVLGIDIAPPLVARAAARVPETVKVVVGDAGHHPYPTDMRFDAVISNFGVMFFDDSAASLAHVRQVVRRGARFAATVWGPPKRNPWFALPRQIVDELIPGVPKPDPEGPGPMRFANSKLLLDALHASGWEAEVKTLPVTLTPPGDPKEVAALHMKVTAGMMLHGLDIAQNLVAQVEAMISDATQTQLIDGAVRVPAEIHVVSATAI